MRKWMSRLTFSFLIIALACGYEAWQGFTGSRPARVAVLNYLLAIAAAAGLVLFLTAVKIRHRGEGEM
jgi:hypothetical protein